MKLGWVHDDRFDELSLWTCSWPDTGHRKINFTLIPAWGPLRNTPNAMHICECNTWMHWHINCTCICIAYTFVKCVSGLSLFVSMCVGSSGGCERFVRGADRFGEDREEDHASSSDAAEVWTLLRPAARGHRISGALWSSSSPSPACCIPLILLALMSPAGGEVHQVLWASVTQVQRRHGEQVRLTAG